ncbi:MULTISPECIES: DUF2059 domain-containing protein [Rhodanobacter]|uniref:DUF2059 domain-containing protein n=1 Tax=Rhodanobacter TaxID=75309 RepID=UPI0003FC8FEB|nr:MULTISPECIES: DUF2059 domain-containing protein [Rhodanobacter]UJJ49859.1 DUF2059 domain-containing protein [Rhodanobacter denitrificans]UJJ57949.1 DUF2059 domain-containing protein [Rhodanobacter denitrificans]UJM92572.1 DUF2059 domain-containing protein [Rhodanobacter denitrificans]UJM96102.1 DUF2059 domain-containing protein [Rhodanobacter denitrificans]UJN21067.1 DUF2059 domain-containing protein [Rhodanobacter denitrificans]
MRTRIRIGALLWLLVSCGAATAAVTASEQQVRDLFKVMRVEQTLGQMNTQMAAQMRQKLPCVPAEYWQGFVDGDGATAVVQRMVPVFQRHFSGEEIDGLLKFYRSPLGQKVLTEMPAAMAEATQAGQQWGQERARTMLQELQKKGSLDAQGRCPAAPEAADEGEAKPAARPAKKHVRHKPVHHHKPAAEPKPATPVPVKSAAPAAPQS